MREGEEFPFDGKSVPLSLALLSSKPHLLMAVQGSAKKRFPGLVNFVPALALPLLPGLACSIHATWGPPFI